MDKIVNSNCKRCPDYKNHKCDATDHQCMCRYCPRNLDVCVKVRWCRETESQVVFDDVNE